MTSEWHWGLGHFQISPLGEGWPDPASKEQSVCPQTEYLPSVQKCIPGCTQLKNQQNWRPQWIASRMERAKQLSCSIRRLLAWRATPTDLRITHSVWEDPSGHPALLTASQVTLSLLSQGWGNPSPARNYCASLLTSLASREEQGQFPGLCAPHAFRTPQRCFKENRL